MPKERQPSIKPPRADGSCSPEYFTGMTGGGLKSYYECHPIEAARGLIEARQKLPAELERFREIADDDQKYYRWQSLWFDLQSNNPECRVTGKAGLQREFPTALALVAQPPTAEASGLGGRKNPPRPLPLRPSPNLSAGHWMNELSLN